MAGLIIDEEMDIGQGQFTRCMLCKQELFISASVYLRRDPRPLQASPYYPADCGSLLVAALF